METLNYCRTGEPLTGENCHVAYTITGKQEIALGRGSELGLLGTTSFTAEATVMIRSWNTDQQRDNAIIGIDDYRAGTWHWVIRNRQVSAGFYFSHGVGCGTPLELNRWYHLAVVYRVEERNDGERTLCHHSLFIDGEQVATTVNDWFPPCTNPHRLHFLGRYAYGRPLNGIISNVRIWNVALEADELKNGSINTRLLSFPPPAEEDEPRLVLSWEAAVAAIENSAFRHSREKKLLLYSTTWGLPFAFAAGEFKTGGNCQIAYTITGNQQIALGTGSDLGLLGNTSFTAEATVMIRKWNTDQQHDNSIIGIDDYRAGTWHWVIRNRKIYASFYYSHDVSYGAPLELNRWYHLAVVYRVEERNDGESTLCHHSLFIDGEQVATTVNDGGFPPCTNPNRYHFLGRYAHGRPLNGIISNVRIWNVALEADELKNGSINTRLLSFPPPAEVDKPRLALSWEAVVATIDSTRRHSREKKLFLYPTSWYWTNPSSPLAALPEQVILDKILPYLPAYEIIHHTEGDETDSSGYSDSDSDGDY